MFINSKPDYHIGPLEVFVCSCIYFRNMYTLFLSAADCIDSNETLKTAQKTLLLCLVLEHTHTHVYTYMPNSVHFALNL